MRAPTLDELPAVVEYLKGENDGLLSDLSLSERYDILQRMNKLLREARAQHVYDRPGD